MEKYKMTIEDLTSHIEDIKKSIDNESKQLNDQELTGRVCLRLRCEAPTGG